MALLLSAIVLVAFSGVPALVGRGRGGGIAAVLAMLGAATGLVVSTLAFLRGDLVSYFHAWPIPYAAFSVGLDPLSSFFLIPIFLLTALSALYGRAYMRGRAGAGRSPLFFGLLAAGMAMVVIARNGMLFLISWEMMAIASFFLVTLDDDRANVRRAGITYLVATHIGTAFLLALFALMAAHAGSMEFSEWKGAAASLPSAGALFILALVGFGTKAGFIPLHVWLPEAHPAAPSHVSALMSGVMIKTGIYGLMRILTLLGAPPEWWGWTLIAIGAISGVMGVLYALAQHELKALLAYHSVENIGIIAIGFGLGLFGVSRGMPVVALLGFGGALLHVLNHAIFKGLLFLGAGAVIRASGTGEIDRLGGLLKRMPHTAAAFLVGSAAISGLPPLNGFVSEFLIYLGAFAILVTPGATIYGALPALIVIASLALIGGLAAACFTKAFGTIFLGEPRCDEAARAQEAPIPMLASMMILAAACLCIGLAAPAVVPLLGGAVGVAAGFAEGAAPSALAEAAAILAKLVVVFAALIAIACAALSLRRRLLACRAVTRTATWDCGYARPAPSMQYTASSFAQPLTNSFGMLLNIHEEREAPQGLFPQRAAFASHARDVAREGLFDPIFSAVASALARLRVIQHGNVHLYILYIAVALIVLLLWAFGGR